MMTNLLWLFYCAWAISFIGFIVILFLLNKYPDENSHDVWKEFEWGDFLLSREESLLLHTIQSERLNTDFSLFKRQPSIESALVI